MVVPPQGRPQLNGSRGSGSERPDPSPPEAPPDDVEPLAELDVGPDALIEDARVVGSDATAHRFTDVRFDRCVLEGVQLTGCDVRGSNWCDVALTDCELSGTRLSESELVRVEVAGGRAAGVVFSESILRHVRFRDCRLDGASFHGATLEHCVFERCNLADGFFVDATLDDVEFAECDLRRADLGIQKGTRLFLVRSDLDGARGVARLRGATITPDSVVALAMSAFAALGVDVAELD